LRCRPHRHGWIRAFETARIHPRRRDTRDIAVDDGAGADGTLSTDNYLIHIDLF